MEYEGLPGGGIGVWGVAVGGVKPNGVTASMPPALVEALVEAAKYFMSIWGETSIASGAGTAGGPAAGSLALYSSGGPLVTATGTNSFSGGVLEVPGGSDGIGSTGRHKGAGIGGGAGGPACSATDGFKARKRKGTGPVCGK